MKNPFSFLFNFFKRLFSKQTSDFLSGQLGPVIKFLEPFVREFAEATSTKADDAVLALYDKYQMGDLFDASKDKGLLLRDLAVQVAREIGGFSLPSHLIITAVEITYAAYRARATEEKL